jgi:hypothetical protein
MRRSIDGDVVCEWLEKWITPRPTWPLQHGIPQGPQSSDFLAEIFLLPIDEEMAKSRGVPKTPVCRALFGGEYSHALAQLKQSEKLFDMGRSQWLNYQNSFNHAAFLALQNHLNRLGLSGASKIRDKHGGIQNMTAVSFLADLTQGRNPEKA